MMDVSIRGLKNLAYLYKTEHKKSVKALDTAIRVEGFRLRKLMQQEIRKSAPGGQKFEPLSIISRRLSGGGRLAPNRPLAVKRIVRGGKRFSMADVIRYDTPKKSPIEMHIGWVGKETSKSWKRLAIAHQEGFTRTITDDQRRFLRRVGGDIKKKSPRSEAAKKFFLKKSTTTFKTPARPIIEPFWNAHENEALRNIKSNFKRKLAGHRI